MASRGLPGFLRRSRRNDFSDDEEESDDRASARARASVNHQAPLDGPAITTTTKAPAVPTHKHTPSKGGVTKTNGGTNHDEPTRSMELKDVPNPLFSMSPDAGAGANANANANHTQYQQRSDSPLLSSSMSSLGGSSTTDNNNSFSHVPQPTRNTERKVSSYRETQFEKTISATVVQMAELRKLGWNGVPVRIDIGLFWIVLDLPHTLAYVLRACVCPALVFAPAPIDAMQCNAMQCNSSNRLIYSIPSFMLFCFVACILYHVRI
jgi:hypothetical protein